MTCERIRPLLSHYHDDALSMDERARVRLHVSTCLDCRAILDAYESMYGVLHGMTVPVPPDLRRNVYARIAEIEARRGLRLPFGPALLGALRSAGGTAGLLAVLGALVAAALHLTTPQSQGPAPSLAIAPALAASTAVSGMVDAVRSGNARTLPVGAQTAVAPLRSDITDSAVEVESAKVVPGSASRVTARLRLVRLAPHSRVPRAIVPVQAQIAVPPKPRSAVVTAMTAEKQQVIPSIPPGDGVVYLRLNSDGPFLPRPDNATAELEFHSFASGSQPRILATPGPASEQLLTGVNASPDGNMVAYSAMGQGHYGGVFGFSVYTPTPTLWLAVPDRLPVDRGYDHLFVKQVYMTTDDRLMLDLSNNLNVSVAMTSSRGMGVLKRIGTGLSSNYVVSPDARRIAWIHLPVHNTGILQVATLGTTPATRTVEMGRQGMWSSHPVWSPDGHSLLFLSSTTPDQDTSGLYLWSDRGGAARELVAPDPDGRQITDFTWAPNGRLFAYVLTSLGKHGASEVRVGDTQTGLTWSAFTQRWVGALAWVHGGTLAAPAQTAKPLAPTVSPTITLGPPEVTVQSGGVQWDVHQTGTIGVPYGNGVVDVQVRFPQSVGKSLVKVWTASPGWQIDAEKQFASGAAVTLRGIAPGSVQVVVQGYMRKGETQPARPLTFTIQTLAPAIATPAPFDDTSTPAGTLKSFYNALDRHDYARAYTYLGYDDGHTLADFTRGYTDTAAVTLTKLLPAGYVTGANVNAVTCVGAEIVGRHWDGTQARYGGWYVLKRTAAQAPRYTGWKIMMNGTNVLRDAMAMVPAQKQCMVLAPSGKPTPMAVAGG